MEGGEYRRRWREVLGCAVRPYLEEGRLDG